jgi:DNA modification methylase
MKCYRCNSWPCECADGQTIIHGDCRRVLRELDPGVIVTDPPYGIEFDYGTEFRDRSGDDYQSLIRPLRPYRLALLQYPEEMMRLCVPVLGAPDDTYLWCYNSNLNRQSRIWGFWGVTPDWGCVIQPPKNPEDRRIRSHEKSQHGVRSYDWCADIQQVKNVSDEKYSHPCQIPVELVKRVIAFLPGLDVVDPFLGSGTTLLAARKLGRRAIGIERERSFCEIAANRLRQSVLDFGDDAA